MATRLGQRQGLDDAIDCPSVRQKIFEQNFLARASPISNFSLDHKLS